MRETTKDLIEMKVFEIDDIKKLCRLLARLSSVIGQDGFVSRPRFTFNFVDGSSYETDTFDDIEQIWAVEQKEVRHISLDLDGYKEATDDSRKVSININSDAKAENYVVVIAENRDWLAGTRQSIKGILASVKNQIDAKNKVPVFFLTIYTGIFYYYLLFVFLVFYSEKSTIDSISVVSFFKILYKDFSDATGTTIFVSTAALGFGLATIIQVQEYLGELWPNIEFDFRKEQNTALKVRRKKVTYLWALCIVPVLTGIVASLITNFLQN